MTTHGKTQGKETRWYQTFTVGYSDSEDRLWIRLTSQEGDVRLWVTRRFVALILEKSFRLLVGERPLAEVVLEHEQLAGTLRHTGTGVSAPEFDPSAENKNLGLVGTIHLNCRNGQMAWVFESALDSVGFQCDLNSAHQVLEVIYLHQAHSGWGLAAPWQPNAANGTVESKTSLA